MRGFRDRDFIKTREDMLFCVIGNIHPSDRVIAYLKYIPNKLGKWGRRLRYSRVLKSYSAPSVRDVLSFLRENFPQYVSRVENMGIEMITVPLSMVKVHFKPEARLSQLLMERVERLDPLERRVVELAELLSKESGVGFKHLGVTGSILLEIHNPKFSDIDMVVYGRENSFKVKEAVKRLRDAGHILWFTGEEFRRWVADKAKQYNLNLEEAEEICRRTWNRGFYRGTAFSIHPARVEEEVSAGYGDLVYVPKGLARVRATVTDVEDSYFLPATYKVSDTEFLHGKPVNDLVEITTYEGFYSGIVETGETVEAMGKVEEVLDRRTVKTHHRLLVGSFEAKGRDYIKPLGRSNVGH